MMELKTNCKDCLHSKMCRFKGNAESDFRKLADTTYGDGVNDDYNWEIMLSSRNVNVTFSCTDFLKKKIISYSISVNIYAKFTISIMRKYKTLRRNVT